MRPKTQQELIHKLETYGAVIISFTGPWWPHYINDDRAILSSLDPPLTDA